MGKETGSDYSVGYKKPPRHSQFKPGQSGNKKGRPKKDKPIADVFLKELRSRVIVNMGGKTQKVSKLEALVIQQVNKAASGDAKATSLVLEVIRSVAEDKANHVRELLDAFRERNRQNMGDERKQGKSADEDATTRAQSPADAIDSVKEAF